MSPAGPRLILLTRIFLTLFLHAFSLAHVLVPTLLHVPALAFLYMMHVAVNKPQKRTKSKLAKYHQS